MKISRTDLSITQVDADAVVAGVWADEPPAGPAAEVDEAAGGLLSRLVEENEVSTAAEKATVLLAVPGLKARVLVVAGLGKREEADAGVAFRTGGTAALALAGKQRGRVAFFPGDGLSESHHEAALAGAIVGCHGQDLYRTKEKKHYPFDELLWHGADEATLTAGRVLGESVNLTRRLVNEPPEVIYPESFAAEAGNVAAEFGIEIEVWDRQRLEKESCGALLAVARGSAREPRLVIMRHRRGGTDGGTLALVGKGVTFDSGGLSLKPSEHMKDMKCDMAGAAAVLGAIRAIAALDLPVNVNGYMGLVENIPGPASYKVGDVLTAKNGTTIEVLNTDAEGRLVLADALCVAAGDGPRYIVDLATLTGACMVALGKDTAGVMANDQDWCETVMAAAGRCGEPVWQLPMFKEYDEQIKSDVADIKNTGEGRWGGAITAAKFLEQFVGEIPWTHIDIAGPAFAEKAKSHLPGGGTGSMVRTLVELARGAREWK